VAHEIQVYGAAWCGVTFRLREYLMNARLSYDFLNIEEDAEARQFVLAMAGGDLRFPVVVVEGHFVADPTIAELQRVLESRAILTEDSRTRRRPA
jgi:disulfide oxidoreductase YuzD